MLFQCAFACLAVVAAVSHGDGEDCSSSFIQKRGHQFGIRSSDCQCPGCPASGATKAPNVLEAMANTGTDKGPSHHQYQRYYDKWLAPFQFKQGLKLVEIGAERGRSLHMWSKYFQNASLIAGLAYGDMTEHVEESSQAWDKVAVYWGDQSKQETMQLLADKGPWDVVIDDGSHYPAHQIFSFFSLWNSVNPGGLYVVEDSW